MTAAEMKTEEIAEEFVDSVPVDGIFYIAREIIHPDPDQPRVEADADLLASIVAQGIIQPITVRPHPELADEWMIVDGERRWRGATEVETIPCRIRLDVEDALDRLALQLAANTGKPLTPLEEARAFKKILDADPDLSQAELAKKLGIARSTVGDRVRLAELPAVWFDLIASGDLQISHAPLIHPFAKLPAKTHASAVKQLQKSWNWQSRATQPIAVEHFKRILSDAYKPLLYPLQRNGNAYQDQPEFAVGSHDKECDCGRVRVALAYADARDYCGNPDWWRPRQTEALSRKTERAAEKAIAKGGRKGEIVIKAKLPTGHQPAIAMDWETPKGVVLLTNRTGGWDTVPQGNYGTPSSGTFDPRDLELEPEDLVPVVDKQSGSTRVGTTATKKVKAAREKFAERLRARQREIIEEYRTSHRRQLEDANVSGNEATLKLLVHALTRWNSAQDVVMAAAVEGVEVPQNLWDTAFERYKSMNETKVREWVDDLAATALSGVLSTFVVLNAEKADTDRGTMGLRTRLETAVVELGREFAGLPVPWIDRPKAKDGGFLVECEGCSQLVSENEIEVSDRYGDSERICAKCRAEEAEFDGEDANEDEGDPVGEAQLAEEDLEEELVEA